MKLQNGRIRDEHPVGSAEELLYVQDVARVIVTLHAIIE